ncbi:head-tail adaptor protein [Chelatococcus sp. SYSU_G07232]|uniref:Head-tail adaptor protein n=1 Tax=Chelatococcus albus TaxID=3047466 RepID=A0ABT7AI17_9HYPH|nr:head-tail adaptor protein [Chelatococcus sp. SYSU_G07232]MDJ1159030.1 head-tail adaptor protein [Chelatococcus sp. SYSU_G07232]
MTLRETTIAALRRRVTLEAPVEAPDDAGGVARSWTPVARPWAAVSAMPAAEAGERHVADRPEIAVRRRLVLRWRPGVDGRLRLRDGERLYRILAAADPDGRRRRLVLTVEEVMP